MHELTTGKAVAASRSKGKPTREFDLRRTCSVDKPSQYKLDNSMEGSNSPSPVLIPINTDNSLLDQYEIRRIALHLDCFMKSSSSKFHCHEYHVNEHNASHKTQTKKNKKTNKFWLRHARICGTIEDVVEAEVSGGCRRVPSKHVEVVGLANCRPRATRTD